MLDQVALVWNARAAGLKCFCSGTRCEQNVQLELSLQLLQGHSSPLEEALWGSNRMIVRNTSNPQPNDPTTAEHGEPIRYEGRFRAYLEQDYN